jgi:DNA/RNA-binding domain of Phe-tRNA-synthetase-like protein
MYSTPKNTQERRSLDDALLTVAQAWREAYPGASVGILAMERVANLARHAVLEQQKEALEAKLRARYGEMDRATLRSLPTFAAYANYYKRFRKSYHVQLQLESIAWKGRSIPAVATLVEAMFMAELDNGLLTAGHDLAAVVGPVRVDVATGEELYRCLNGHEQVLKAGDMYIADSQGVLSSILYGPDARTPIGPETKRVLFTVYAPAGIEPASVQEHLEEIRDYARLIAPGAEVVELAVYRG